MQFRRLRTACVFCLLGWLFAASLHAAEPECMSADLCLGMWAGGKCVERPAQPNEATTPTYGLDDRLRIDVKGGCYQKLDALLKSRTRDTVPVTLFLRGIEMQGLPLTLSQGTSDQATLSFLLRRNSQDEANRDAWTKLLGSQHGGTRRVMDVAVAMGPGIPVSVPNAASAGSTIAFEVQDGTRLHWIIGLSILVFALMYAWFILSPGILRDSRGGPYSLGRAQMAFWFLLVLTCLVAIFFTTGSLERLPSQVLILLGISSATGFAARVVGNTKNTGLEAERTTLLAAQAANPAGFVAGGGPARLAAIEAALHPNALNSWKNFLKDICSDGDGVSIYRVQVVFWTLTLGGFFVWTVAQVVAMPEFPTELLTLLGISNSTYVALKVPEST